MISSFRFRKQQAYVLRPGRSSGQCEPLITEEGAAKFASFSRPQKRLAEFIGAMAVINSVAGGESRSRRRSMARAKIQIERRKLAGKAKG